MSNRTKIIVLWFMLLRVVAMAFYRTIIIVFYRPRPA